MFKMTASGLCLALITESVTIVNEPAFESAEKAEAVGLGWAESLGVEQLFASTGTLAQLLKQIEIVYPL